MGVKSMVEVLALYFLKTYGGIEEAMIMIDKTFRKKDIQRLLNINRNRYYYLKRNHQLDAYIYEKLLSLINEDKEVD